MKKAELDEFLIKGNLNLIPATFLDAKESRILARVSKVMRYQPDEELYPALLLSLLRYPKQFKKIRSIVHLSRLIATEFFYKKKVIQALDQFPEKRHLFVKLLRASLDFPFGSKNVLGIAVCFNLMKQREAFEELHILEATRRILPKIKEVKGSFLDYQDKQNQVQTVYLEIEKETGNFTLEELRALQKTLPDEFKGCIEQLVPVTFMRRNEEEVYRNILQLRDQLKTIRDLPQATITFEEQTQFDLFFTVVLLRIVKGNELSLQQLFEKNHPDVTFILERIDRVGTLRKNYAKEATVFRLQLPKSQFFRKDRSVNLYKARRKVLSMLMKAIGPVRDFNGGLILKQDERLEDFLSLMPGEYDAFNLENFFYSITPIAMQSILPSALVKEWFLSFSELMERAIPRKEVYLILCRTIEEATLVVVRAEDRSFKSALLKEINALAIPSLELAFSEIAISGTLCFGFLYRPSMQLQDQDFCQLVHKTMKRWSEKFSKEQTLRIVIHGNQPSLDPRLTKEDQSYIMIKMLFEGLTRLAPDGKIQMAIAESFEVSADFKTYTFHLRESKWSNGMPVTAHDFEYSWKKALNSQAVSVFSNGLYLIKNAALAKENKIALDAVGVRALDDKTLLVELETPTSYFPEVVSHWTYSLINRAIDQKYPGWAYQDGETFVSNGPFKLLEWMHSRAIIVEKNPYYWDSESVKLQKIYISMLENDQRDTKLLEKGDVDIIGKPMTSFPALKTEKMVEVDTVSYALSGIYTLCFNTSQFPFNHKKLRQAFAYAIDRNQIAHLMAPEFRKNGTTLLPSELSFFQESLFPNGAIEKAQKLFKEGLGEIGFVKSDFPKLTLSFYNNSLRSRLISALCAQWKEAFQIDVHPRSEEWSTFFGNLLQRNFQIGALEVHAKWSDPLHLLETFEDKDDRLNFSHWESKEFRAHLQKAKQASNREVRDEYLKKAEAFLADEVPAVPLYELSGNYLKKRDLQGVFASKYSQVIDFKWAYKI